MSGRAPLLAYVYRIGLPVYRIYLRVRRPRTLGARAVVVAPDGRVALVQHRLSGRWHLPGGGVKRREGFESGMLREVREETGLNGLAIERVLGVYHSLNGGKDDNIVVYLVRAPAANALLASDAAEIAQAAWFAPDAFPKRLNGGTRRRLAEFRADATGGGQW